MGSFGFVEVESGAMNTSMENAKMSIQPLLTYDKIIYILSYLLTISIPICIFGIFTNIVNILVFYKMGFSSPTNISLFCLSIADLLTLCYSLVASFGNYPAFQNADLCFSMHDVSRVGAHVYYSSCAIGSWITAVINVERSVCVVFPMKVKQIFTRKTTARLIAGMVIYQIASGLPRSFGVRFAWIPSAVTNSTRISYVIFNPRLVSLSYLVSFSIPNLICFFVVVLGTIFLISKFKQSRQLRSTMSVTGKKSNEMSDKDVRLVRSMIFISALYIFGAAPNVLLYIVHSAYPSLHIDNPYLGYLHSLLLLATMVLQAASCSVNIFVYVRMGSNFKAKLREMFCCRSEDS
ncbi:hypothetical protein RRG08_033829 [Elysia crispata]|uniref:G-protein coupled receptors family 1 profile domain-containing protein n=1 Tax=Elysia crispata TaxID=231223 RepID=A0AAE0XVY9_9GAST|nr:hypothetical protein RRG08_033829 [Elysia crispata]